MFFGLASVPVRFLNSLIFLVYSIALVPTVFGRLRTDELYFTSCAFDLANGESKLCYSLSIFPGLLSVFLDAANFDLGILAFKVIEYALVLGMFPVVLSLVRKKPWIDTPVHYSFLLFGVLIYIASVQAVEARPEILSSICFSLSLLLCFSCTNENEFRRGVALGLVVLSIALTPRMIPVGFIAAAFILLFNPAAEAEVQQLNFKKLLQRAALFSLFLCLALLYIYLTGQLASPQFKSLHVELESVSFAEKVWYALELGVAHNLRYHPNHAEVYYFFKFFRPLIILGALVLAINLALRSLSNKNLSGLILSLLPFAWLVTLLVFDKRPHGYVVILESTILFTFIYYCRPDIFNFRLVRILSPLLVMVVFLGVIQNNRTVNPIDFSDTRFATNTNTDSKIEYLLDGLNSSNILTQLSVRKRICTNHGDYEFVMSYYFHIICKPNVNHYNAWFSDPVELQEIIASNEKLVTDIQHSSVMNNPEFAKNNYFYIKQPD